jgi:hypothetical protein
MAEISRIRYMKPKEGLTDVDSTIEKALAILISNTRNRKRPLSLTEIAGWLDIAARHFGGHSAVADRIGLSSKMLRQFSCVTKLPEPVQHLFARRNLDSVDAAAHLAVLPAADQTAVAEALAAGQIDTSDVRAIVEMRRRGHKESSEEIVDRVKSSKTIREYVAEFLAPGGSSPGCFKATVARFIPPSEIVRVEIDGPTGRLVLTRKGKVALGKAARTLGVPLKGVLPRILQENKQA